MSSLPCMNSKVDWTRGGSQTSLLDLPVQGTVINASKLRTFRLAHCSRRRRGPIPSHTISLVRTSPPFTHTTGTSDCFECIPFSTLGMQLTQNKGKFRRTSRSDSSTVLHFWMVQVLYCTATVKMFGRVYNISHDCI